jgi:hypothetical protein
VTEAGSRRPRPLGRGAVWAAVAVLGVASATLAGCDVTGDDDESVATTPTTPTTTDTATGSAPGPGTTEESVTGEGQSEPTEPTSGGTEAPEAAYDPEQDVEGHDIPPPKGSPAEQFEKECAENPEIC